MGNEQTIRGRVVSAHGRHYSIELPDGTQRICFPKGKKTDSAVGDEVLVQLEGNEEGVIVKRLERRNLLYRSDDMRTKQFAANVDLLLIVVATTPAFSDDLVGRAIVAAQAADINCLIILNKADIQEHLPAARERLKPFRAIGLPIIELSALDTDQVNARLLPHLKNKTCLLLGQSGMGKSTLLNTLIPNAQAQTQAHSIALDAGKHTTTHTRLYDLPQGGHLIDSPGFQNFGLYHLSNTEIETGFAEFEPYAGQCRFYNCSHRHEPGCAVLQAVSSGAIPESRHALYMRLLAENEAQGRY